MDFDKILKQITAGLSGENAKDIAYLKEQCEKYKEHEYSQEIIRACGRMFYDNENNCAQSQIYYIEQTAPEGYQKPTVELLEQYEEQLGLPRGADDDVIGLAHAYSKKAIENGDKDLAVYFLGIFCGLTDDEEALKLLDSLTKDLSEE